MNNIRKLNNIKAEDDTLLEKIDDWLWETKIVRIIYQPLRRLYMNIIEIPRKIKWGLQSLFRGYSDCDLWGLNTYICKKTIKPLKAFRKMNKFGHPCGLKNNKEWNKILDRIIFMMDEELKNGCWGDDKIYKIKDDKKRHKKINEYNNKIKEGCRLFGEYFLGLWD